VTPAGKTTIALAVALALTVGGVIAQDTQPRPDQSLFRIQEKPASRYSSPAFQQAQQLMIMSQFERAAAVLERELGYNPTETAIISLLAECYESLGDYGKLLILLNRQAALQTPDFNLSADLGQAYLRNGQTDSARYWFFHAARLTNNLTRVLTRITDAYQKLGHYPLEQEFVDSLRAWHADSTLLAEPMGNALAAQGDYAGATREYLTYMESDSAAAEVGENKIVALLQYPESADKVMAVVGTALTRQLRNPRLANVYAQVLMEQGRFDEAYDLFRRRDSLMNTTGSDLLYFMQECRRRGRNDYVVTAGTCFLQRYPSSGLAVPARFVLVDGLIGLGKFIEANSLLDSLIPSTRTTDRAEALLQSGILQRDHLDRPDSAESLFRQVIRLIPGSRFDTDARLELADLFVRQRRFDSAVTIYDTLLARDLPDDKAEQITFLRAQTSLFKGECEQSAEAFRNLIRRFPRGMYVNDAIQIGMILSEALGEAPKQMDLFSQAEYFRYTGRTDSLEYYLTKICQIDIPGLAPVAYLRLGDLRQGQNRFPEAIAAADSLVGRYPDSYFAPFGLKLKADILWLDPKTKDEAAALYRDLLERYGTYPFSAEIRDILRRSDQAKRS
jgi:tetratricopeptide (TPR) repeat protein